MFVTLLSSTTKGDVVKLIVMAHVCFFKMSIIIMSSIRTYAWILEIRGKYFEFLANFENSSKIF